MNNRIKCTSCGIDISFDDIPENGIIECGVCGTSVKLPVPIKNTEEPAAKENTSRQVAANGMEAEALQPSTRGNDSTKPEEASIFDKGFNSSSIVREIEGHHNKSVLKSLSGKKVHWLSVLVSALVMTLLFIFIFFFYGADKTKWKTNTSISVKNTPVFAQPIDLQAKNEKQETSSSVSAEIRAPDKDAVVKTPYIEGVKPDSTCLSETDISKKTEKEKRKTEEKLKSNFSKDIDEEKVKKILIAEKCMSIDAIERGINKSLNEIKEEIKTEHKRLVDLKYQDTMLEQIKKDAYLKFNKDDMQTPDVKFPQEMLDKITDEANGKYKLIKVGDTITAPKRQSAGYIDITGTYYGIAGDKILVKDSKILILDLPSDITDRLTEESVNKKKSTYIAEKYYIPKQGYEKQRRTELEKAKQNIADYIQANYHIPKLEYTKTSKQEVESRIFMGYGYIFDNAHNSWDYFGDYLKSKYSEFRNMKKEMFSLLDSTDEQQKTYEEISGLYEEAVKSITLLKSKTRNIPRIIKIYAYIISVEKENYYEIAMTEYDSYLNARVPTDKHAFLITETSTFSSKGNFSMDVIVFNSIPVKLKSEFGGFNQNWTVYKEANYDDRKFFIELNEKENLVSLLKVRLNDLNQSRLNTDNRIKEIKKILGRYEAI